MAVVSVTENITVVDDFDNAPPGTLATIGGGPFSGIGSDMYYQGSASCRRRINSTDTDFGFSYTHTSTYNILSDGTRIWWVKHICTVDKAMNGASGEAGALVAAGDSVGNGISVLLADDGTAGDSEDFKYPIAGGWIIVPVELALSAYKTLGVIYGNLTIVDVFYMTNNVSATSTGDNQALDSVQLSDDGLFLVGGDSTDPDGTFQDFLDADEGEGVTNAARIGMWRTVRTGVIEFFGHHVVGKTDAGTVTATVFTDSQKVLICPGGQVAEGRNALEFDLNNATTDVTLTQISVLGRGRTAICHDFDTELNVNATTDRITVPGGHGFGSGDQVQYQDNGGTQDIGPDDTNGEPFRVNATTSVGSGPYWYVRKFDDDEFYLHPTVEDALKATSTEPLTASGSGNGERHTLERTPDARPDITFTGTLGDAELIDCTLEACRIITLRSPVTITRGFISGCKQLILNDATLSDVNISEPATFPGEAFIEAIHANDLDVIDGCNFASTGDGHFIEITTNGTVAQDVAALADVNFDGTWPSANDTDNTGGVAFDPDSTGSGGDVDLTNDEIDITGHPFTTGDIVYYSDEGGTVITGLTDQARYVVRSVNANSISLHLTEQAATNNVNKVNMTAGSTDATHKLYSANADIFNNTGTAITVDVTGGNAPSIRNGAGATTTVNAGVPVTIKCIDENGVAIQDARVILGTSAGDTSIINNVLTNASGEVTTTYSGTTPQAVEGYAAKGSEEPTYKRTPISGTIVAGSGYTQTVLMVAD